MRRAPSPTIVRFYSKARLDEEILSCSDDFELGMHFVALLKACTKDRDLCRGGALHTEVSELGLLNTNVFVGSTLVNMYIKCGDFETAQHVFNELPVRNVVGWNALISGYAQHGYGKEALSCYEQMLLGCINPNAVTFISVLKACGGLKALDKGQELHTQIVNGGFLETDNVLASALIDMYSKCGALSKAQEVFDRLHVQSSSSWSTMISSYVQAGLYEEAWSCFEQRQKQGFSPNDVTFACMLKACGYLGDLGKGQHIHTQIAREQWLKTNVVVGNALISMYINCGAIEKAEEVLEELSAPNLVTWTELIAGFSQHGLGAEALLCAARLQANAFAPDSVAYTSILKACGVAKALEKGKSVHAQLVKDSTLEKDVILWSELMDMYAKCDTIELAQEVFDKLTFRDVAIWNVLIKGYNLQGCCQEAFICFERMQQGGFVPNEVTYLCILESCGILRTIGKVHLIHAHLVRSSLLQTDVMVANALVKAYMQCCAIRKAREVFNELPVQDTVSWNVLISGYVEHGNNSEALKCYEYMKVRGLSPNSITTACVFKACGNIGALDKGEEVHAQASEQGLLHDDDVIGNSLVDMYAKCGAFKQAEALLYEQPSFNAIPWNVLISGCTQDNKDEKAFTYFEQMQLQGCTLDAVTFVCTLRACASRSAALKGQEIHNKIILYGLSEFRGILDSALLCMYAKCGMLVESQYLFGKMPFQDVVSWTALMASCALLGKDDYVCDYFKDMQLQGIQPNFVTLYTLLQTYRRGGLVDKGQVVFDKMRNGSEFSPELEHYICMVDLLASAGFIENALKLFEEKSNPVLWHTLLDACRKRGNADLGKWAFEQMENHNAGARLIRKQP